MIYDPDYILPASYQSKTERDPEPYRGFSIIRRRPHFLYAVEPREGYDLPGILGGQFTHLPLLHHAIDTYLTEAGASADKAYKKHYEQPKRGRPKKAMRQNEQQSNNQEAIA